MGKASRRKKAQGEQGGKVKVAPAPYVARPFEGLPGETDWVAAHEIIPAATATLTLTGEGVPEGPPKTVTLATVLPMARAALHRADGEVFAQTVAENGDPGYWSVIIVPKDSPIQSVDDLLKCDQSVNFGLGDPNSTSGFLVPMTFVFSARDIDPKSCFRNVTNANHETNAMAVAKGQLDAAANNTESMALIEANSPDSFANIREIWRSPLIPSDPLVWRKDLSDETKQKVRDFMLTYGTDQSTGDVAHERAVLAGLQWAPFRASTDDQLLPIRVMEAEKAIGQARSDTSLSEEARAARIAELESMKKTFEEKLAAAPQG